MSKQTIEDKILTIRTERRNKANTKVRVADVLADINQSKADLIEGKVPLDQLPEIPDEGIISIQEGENIEIDTTDPQNPVVTSIRELTQSFKVNKEAGGFLPGDIFPEGMSLTEAFRALLTTVYNPELQITPSLTLTSNIGVREVGETFDLVLTATFKRGSIMGKLIGDIWDKNAEQNPRSGLPNKYLIDGTIYNTSTLNQVKTLSLYKIPTGSQNFDARVDYDQGPQPKNSLDENFESPLPASHVSQSLSITGYMRRFSGNVAVIPTSGQNIRNLLLSTSVLNTGNAFSLFTGTVNTTFVIAIPSNKTLIDVFNTAPPQDLTSEFILSSINTIPDAGGTNRSYKVYIMKTVLPYSTNSEFKIRIS